MKATNKTNSVILNGTLYLFLCAIGFSLASLTYFQIIKVEEFNMVQAIVFYSSGMIILTPIVADHFRTPAGFETIIKYGEGAWKKVAYLILFPICSLSWVIHFDLATSLLGISHWQINEGHFLDVDLISATNLILYGSIFYAITVGSGFLYRYFKDLKKATNGLEQMIH